MEIRFAKYEASGNDFVLIEGEPLAADAVRRLCDRRKGVGADGLISVTAGTKPPLRFRLVNADGSEAEVSGNGLMCLGAFAHDRGLTEEVDLDVETPAGLRHVSLEVTDGGVSGATVDMGEPRFSPPDIPMLWAGDSFIGQPFEVGPGIEATAVALSMGNPHLVLFVEKEPAAYDLASIGPSLEHHALFPRRTNVELALARDDALEVRVWERGVGETRSCGTGACAVAVAANELGMSPARVTVTFPGGPLTVERTAEGTVLIGGPVSHVSDGVAELGAA